MQHVKFIIIGRATNHAIPQHNVEEPRILKAAIDATVLMRVLFPRMLENIAFLDFLNFIIRLLWETHYYEYVDIPDLYHSQSNFALFHTLFLLHDLSLSGYNTGDFDAFEVFIAAHIVTLDTFQRLDFPWTRWAASQDSSSFSQRLPLIIHSLVPKILHELTIGDGVITGLEKSVHSLRQLNMVRF